MCCGPSFWTMTSEKLPEFIFRAFIIHVEVNYWPSVFSQAYARAAWTVKGMIDTKYLYRTGPKFYVNRPGVSTPRLGAQTPSPMRLANPRTAFPGLGPGSCLEMKNWQRVFFVRLKHSKIQDWRFLMKTSSQDWTEHLQQFPSSNQKYICKQALENAFCFSEIVLQ